MSVAYRSSATVTNGTAGTAVTVAKPAGIVDTGSNPGRDHLIAVIAAAGAPTMTPPAGWTLIDTVASGSSVTMWVYRKLASSEGASWTWTLGSSLRNWGVVLAYTGVDPTDPVFNSQRVSALDTTTTVDNLGSVTPSGGYVMAVAATRTASGAATTWVLVDKDGLTAHERADLSTNAGAGTDITGVVVDVAWPKFYQQSLGADATASQAQTVGVSEMVMLRPYFVPYDGSVGGTGIVVEAAFDVDPDTDSDGWTWTDVTAYVHHPARVSLKHGLGNRARVADPSEMRFTLLNEAGEFTNPAGTYGTKLIRNLPFRVRLNGFGVGIGDAAGGYHRGTAFLSSANPRWDATLEFSVVDIVANGRLRREQQGDEPLHSAAYTAVQRMGSTAGLATPVAHWPCEDGSDSTTTAASAVSGVPPAVVSGVTFAGDSTCAGSAPLMKLSASSTFNALVPGYSPTGTWTVMFVATVAAEPAVETGLLAWRTTGTAALWRVTIAPGAPAKLHIQAYNAAGTQILDDPVDVTEATFFGAACFYTITATQAGPDITYAQVGYGPGSAGNSGTLAGYTHGNVVSFTFSPQAGLANCAIGHIALHVEPGAEGISTSTAVLDANAGEWPWQWFERLSGEQGVPYTSDASANTNLTMGTQSVASLVSLLREAETVETSAVLNDSGAFRGLTGLLWFPSHTDRENISPALTLDMSQGQVTDGGFAPVLDDQDIVNDVTASRTGGSSARVVDDESIAAEGRYRRPVTVNTEDDTTLADLAGQRVNLGTVKGMRFSSVRWSLRRSPTLAEDWVNMALFERLDIVNPPSQYPPDDIAAILEGYTETISNTEWTVAGYLSPYDPYHVAEFADVTADANEWQGRFAEDVGCALRTAVDSDDLSLLVDPNRTRWTTVADDFDPDIEIRMAGEVMAVSGIATTAGTFVAVGAASHADNAAVSPAIYAGGAAGDALFVVAAIRSSGTGRLTTPTGYTRLSRPFAATDNVQVFVKLHSGSESAPSVTPTGGAVGDTVSALTFGLRGTSRTLDDLNDMVVDAATLLNASAANIAYPGMYPRYQEGCILLLVAWKQDDYTSVAVPSGWTEMIEASSTTGSDQSLYVAYQIQTTPALADGGSLVVTGGASAISRATTFALAAGYQTFTVSARSVNGVVKSHTAGTPVEVEDPGRKGL